MSFQATTTVDRFEAALLRIEHAIQRLIDARDRPFVFLRSNRNNLSSNVAADVYIMTGPQVPYGYKGILRDLNLNFSTIAGTVKIVITDAENTILFDITLGIAASASGIGETVIEEGQRVAVMGQTAGAGVFGVNMTGILVKQNP